jgi:hypothetical protein
MKTLVNKENEIIQLSTGKNILGGDVKNVTQWWMNGKSYIDISTKLGLEIVEVWEILEKNRNKLIRSSSKMIDEINSSVEGLISVIHKRISEGADDENLKTLTIALGVLVDKIPMVKEFDESMRQNRSYEKLTDAELKKEITEVKLTMKKTTVEQ